MSKRCRASLDITEELCTNSTKLRNFPGLYECVPRYYRGIGPQISVLTEQFFLLRYWRKIIINYFYGVGLELMLFFMMLRRSNHYTTAAQIFRRRL